MTPANRDRLQLALVVLIAAGGVFGLCYLFQRALMEVMP